MVKVSNFTVGDLKACLEKFDDSLDLIVEEDGTPLDIHNVKLKSYDPDGYVQEDHIQGSVLSVVLRVSPFDINGVDYDEEGYDE